LNPIQSDGAAAIFNTLQVMPIKELDLGSCGITETITKLFMMLVCQHTTLLDIDLSNNSLGEVGFLTSVQYHFKTNYIFRTLANT